MAESAHVIILGAGLSGSLLAWALKRLQPSLKVLLIDSRTAPLSKTWSFHDTDVAHMMDVFDPLTSYQWDGYQVHFNSYSRTFTSKYLTVKPQHLDEKIKAVLGSDYLQGVHVQDITENSVKLRDGQHFHAACVVDARGIQKKSKLGQGYQKFVGLQVRLSKPHGLSMPVLMDARLPQLEGYRFMYLLPLTDTELLIEDTRYSDDPLISVEGFKNEIFKYAESKGWRIQEIQDIEKGALPIPYSAEAENPSAVVPKIGVSGGYFHPVTGYSFADSARIAFRVANLKELTTKTVTDELQKYKAEATFDQKFFHLLNRMLFWAAKPEKRVKVFEHFYKLPEPLVQNFYKGQMSWAERLRILSGKPPVPVAQALTSSLGWRIS